MAGFGDIFVQHRLHTVGLPPCIFGREPLPLADVLYMRTVVEHYRVSVERWVENPYWQFFCGFEFFQREAPIGASTMTHRRKRIGPQGLEELLKTSIEAALETGTAKPESLERINVDTTVQPKAIAPPTDSGLYLKALQMLVRQAEKHGIELRQSCMRLAKAATVRASRYAHAGQFRRMHRELKRLRTFIGRILHGIGRKIAVNVELERNLRPAAGSCRTTAGAKTEGQEQALFAACSRGRLHLEGQSSHAIRVRLQGRYRAANREGLVLTAMTFEDNPSRGTRSHAPSIRLLRRCRSGSHLRR